MFSRIIFLMFCFKANYGELNVILGGALKPDSEAETQAMRSWAQLFSPSVG